MQSTESSKNPQGKILIEDGNITPPEEILPSDKSHDSRDEKVSEEEGLKEDETQYPKGVKFVAICVAICLAIFLVALVSRPIVKRNRELTIQIGQ